MTWPARILDALGGYAHTYPRQGDDPARVRILQTSLDALGYDPGPVDGLVGMRTWTAYERARLEHWYDRTDPAQEACRVFVGWAMDRVREARQNRGALVDEIIRDGGGRPADAPPWCVYAVQAAWSIGARRLGLEVDRSRIRSTGSTWRLSHLSHPDQVRWREDWRSTSDIASWLRPGDCLIRYSLRRHVGERWERSQIERSDTYSGHVELVLHCDTDGWLVTVGGNTDDQRSREGNGVHLHWGRYTLDDDDVQGFVRPRFLRPNPAPEAA